jgi:hypothetical protein
MGLDEVHRALRKLTTALEADGIPYAIVGAMAMNAHGYRRVTVGVDVLLTSEASPLSRPSTWDSVGWSGFLDPRECATRSSA